MSLIDQTPLPPQQSQTMSTTDTTALAATPDTNPMRLLEMALASPDLPVERMGQLMDLQDRWEENQAKKAFAKALVAFQQEMPVIKKERNGDRGKYKFAGFDDIYRKARPILASHGLAITFSQHEDDNTLTVTARVSHVDGHTTETPFTLPKDAPIQTRDGRNVTNMAQAQGSANSYAKRYCLCNALNIVVSDEDDDALATSVEYITADEVTQLLNLIEKTGSDKGRFLKWLGVPSLEQLPAAKFSQALVGLEQKGVQQ